MKHPCSEKGFPTHLPLNSNNSLFLREEVITATQTLNMELKGKRFLKYNIMNHSPAAFWISFHNTAI